MINKIKNSILDFFEKYKIDFPGNEVYLVVIEDSKHFLIVIGNVDTGRKVVNDVAYCVIINKNKVSKEKLLKEIQEVLKTIKEMRIVNEF